MVNKGFIICLLYDLCPLCCIVNTDPIDKPGQHWIALYYAGLGKSQGEFFDSYALRPEAYKHDTWKKCFREFDGFTRPLQQWNSDVCGDYTIYFLYRRVRGESLREIVKYFSKNDLQYNDAAVVERVHGLFGDEMKTVKHRGLRRNQMCCKKRDNDCFPI